MPLVPSGIAKEATLENVLAELQGGVSVDDGGGSITVDGAVNVTGSTVVVVDGGGSVTVDGTVTATGPLTDAQLRATAVPISDGGGSVTVDGTVGVSGTIPVSGPLTDAQLRASALPVTVSSQTPGTGATNLGKARDDPAGAADVGVVLLAVRNDTVGTLVGASGDYTPLQTGPNGRLRVLPASEYKVVATGNLNAAGSVAGAVSEYGTALLSVSGTFTAAALVFEGYDGANWVSIQAVRTDSTVVETGATLTFAAQTRAWECSCHAFEQVRVRLVSITSGTVAVRITGSGTAIEPVPAAQVPAALETSASLSALNASATLAVNGQAGAVIQVTGTFVGTLTFYSSYDGVNSVTTAVVPVGGGTSQTTTSGTGAWQYVAGGAALVRVQMSAYTSGTAVVTIRATAAAAGVVIVGGQIDRLVAGTSASSIGKAEDAVAASGDTGLFALYVRRDTVTAAPASATGDYSEGVVGADGIQAVRVVPSSVTTGAPTRHRLVAAAATTNGTSVKATAGRLYHVRAVNTTAATKYLKLYDKATAPTVGTDVPIATIPLPPNTINGGLYDSGQSLHLLPEDFTAGIAYALTGAATDADTTALAAGDIVSLTMRYL